MAKGFEINGTDFDDLFEPTRAGFSTVTFTGLSPTCTYMTRTGDASNPNAAGYYNYNGTLYDAHPKGYNIPKSLTVGGSWSNTQYTSQAPDTTGLTYTVTYQDGTTASVAATLTSPSTWSSTAGTQTATFSYTYHGVTVTATKTASVVSPHNWSSWKKVGGTIFYIDSTSTTYEFKNASGTAVSAPTVGTDCTNWTYRYDLDEYTKDKFYVYESATGYITGKCWSYYKTTTSATGNSIGDGKTNTSTVLAITDTTSYASGSIWKYIRDMRTNKTNGCDDWFVGCDTEYDQLRSSGTTGASWFNIYNNVIWSSRERDSYRVYGWNYSRSYWDNYGKRLQYALVPLRAF